MNCKEQSDGRDSRSGRFGRVTGMGSMVVNACLGDALEGFRGLAWVGNPLVGKSAVLRDPVDSGPGDSDTYRTSLALRRVDRGAGLMTKMKQKHSAWG